MSPCKTQYENPDNASLATTCATAHGLDYATLQQCATSAEGAALLLQDAKDFNVSYGAQGLPVVQVAGKIVSGFAACHVPMDKVLTAICDAITAPTKPAKCATITPEAPRAPRCDARAPRPPSGDCPAGDTPCEYATGKTDCCSPGEMCIPNVGCRC